MEGLGGAEYFARSGVRKYLEDALCGLLTARDKSHCVEPSTYMLNYFWHVRNGTHTTLREYDYISLTPYNRVSFLSSLWKSFQSLMNRIMSSSLKAGQHSEISQTFADLYRIFQFHLFFEG
ncbi:hypothetical protein FBUS_11682 [Fasciolopsis buskii]|uniref:Centriolar satellite-associated tubulin polyglutamylase complex regulator 1 n=1 Tax=Fasciolopsis buskii TaxID=27845 RepID=A0A8E0VHE9_9TREM|nr:hypothetical protein FBUS_11682 [Fasciolopsis buski]